MLDFSEIGGKSVDEGLADFLWGEYLVCCFPICVDDIRLLEKTGCKGINGFGLGHCHVEDCCVPMSDFEAGQFHVVDGAEHAVILDSVLTKVTLLLNYYSVVFAHGIREGRA